LSIRKILVATTIAAGVLAMAVPADAAKPPKTYTGTIADGRGTITLTQTKKVQTPV
jgi:hypothetical protein